MKIFIIICALSLIPVFCGCATDQKKDNGYEQQMKERQEELKENSDFKGPIPFGTSRPSNSL